MTAGQAGVFIGASLRLAGSAQRSVQRAQVPQADPTEAVQAKAMEAAATMKGGRAEMLQSRPGVKVGSIPVDQDFARHMLAKQREVEARGRALRGGA